MTRKLFLNLLLFALLVFNFMFWFDVKAADSSLTLAEKLQHVLDTEIERHDGIGVSAAVIIPGRKPWLGASGVSHGTTSITTDMIFSIGSNTKNFMAALILQLAEEGKLSLEDPLNKYLASYPNIDSTITIRQLLNHTSGIYHFTDHPSIWDTIFANQMRLWTPEEILANFVLQPYFSPGTGWHYSNTNYILLGMIVEVITGSKVSTELRNRFFDPLGLTRTFFDIEEQITGVMAHRWYDFFGDGTPDDISFLIRTSEYSAYWTAGAMVSTAEDLARWSQALFRGNVLSQFSLDQMLTFHSPTPGEPMMVGYGLGTVKFLPALIAGEEAFGHGGWVFGHSTVMTYFPEYDVSISILLNKNDDNCISAIVDGLIRVVNESAIRIPRYRLYNPYTFHHHYTTDANEYNVLGTLGWIQEGTGSNFYNGYYVIDNSETVPYYRLYNPNSYEHHWTTDANEYKFLGTIGWIREGADGYVFATQVSGSEPLHRLYNPNDGLHHWTMDTDERDVLIGYGWIDEGIACYVFP